jgi:diguanylate cyclase (GGDEF)-like protein
MSLIGTLAFLGIGRAHTTPPKFWLLRMGSALEFTDIKGRIPRIPRRSGPGRSVLAIQLMGLSLIVLTLLVAGFAVWDMRNRDEEEYRRNIATLGAVLSEQTFRYIQQTDLVLHQIQYQCLALGIQTPAEFRNWLGSSDARTLLKGYLQNMPQVDALIGVDAAGHLVISTRANPTPDIDVLDRDYFRHFAEHDNSDLFVSEPTFSRVANKSTVFLARRVIAPDGTFLGLVAGAAGTTFLDQFYQAISTKPGQSVTLLRTDGLILTRTPDPTHLVSTTMPKGSPWYEQILVGGGTYTSPGYLGGTPALVSVHPLRDYPLVIDVSIKEYEVLAAWRHQAMLFGLAGLIAAAGFALLFWFIAMQFRRQAVQNASLLRTSHDLQESEQRNAQKSDLLETTLNCMDQGLMMIASDDTVAIYNRRALELLDLPKGLMESHPKWKDVLAHKWGPNKLDPTDDESMQFARRSALLDGPLAYDSERANGSYLEVRTAPLTGGKAVRTYTDITVRKLAEKRIEFQAHHDALTGLANRVLLLDRLSLALGYADRPEHPQGNDNSLAVLALDLDRFKEVNDAYGHDAGDDVLVQVADRLRKTVRATDTVARVGGDEFVVMQIGGVQPASAVALAQRLIDAVSQPFDLAGDRVEVGTSLGISMYFSDGDTAAQLLKNADTALYRAKANGSGAFCLFEPDMDRQASERRAIEHDLRSALATDALTIHFQPQFTCETGIITGFEALVRWKHPVRGNIPPSIFIPIAEESSLIVELGGWILQTACAAASSWSVPHRVAVNLSPAQFRGGDLPHQVTEVLRRSGLAASRLELEVTETLLIGDTTQALATLRSLKEMGVRIALDDFGTGYSSLSYLLRFPFDKIKIDQSFVQALGEDPNALSIINAILAMGRSLGLDVIAEGVETEQQLRILAEHHCSEVQGFLVGRPLPAEDVRSNLDHTGPKWPSNRNDRVGKP